MYNYYSFFSINFLQEGSKIKIGKFVDSNLEFSPNFLQYIKLFSIIDSCEKEIKDSHPEFNGNFLDNEDKTLEFRTLVHKCYLQKIELDDDDAESEAEEDEDEAPEGKWICPLCDTLNENTEPVCTNEECDMEFDDL